jgi:SET domain-containing protein
MSRRPFRVGRAVTGLGLFATRLIKKRTRIVEYKGPLLPNKIAEKAERRGNKYLYEINSRWTIDGSPRSNLARYSNHSCNPNAEAYDVGHRAFIRAMRDIRPGEEIVYHYGMDYLRNVIGISNCRCSRCRGRKARKAREARARKKRAMRRAAKRTARKRQSRPR